MKTVVMFTLIFLLIAIMGLVTGKLMISFIALPMIGITLLGHKVFAKQDKEWNRKHPPAPIPTEEALDKHECICNYM